MHTGPVEFAYAGIAAVVVIGVAVVAYGWLSDRTVTKHHQEQATGVPDRAVPGLAGDAPPPAYLTGYEILTTPGRTVEALTDQQRTRLDKRLASTSSLPYGYAADEFVTDPPSHRAVLDAPLVLVADEPVTTFRELLVLFQKTHPSRRTPVVVAPRIAGEVLDTLRVNAKRTMSCCAIIVEDPDGRAGLAEAVGARPVSRADLVAGYLHEDSLGSPAAIVVDAERLWVLDD